MNSEFCSFCSDVAVVHTYTPPVPLLQLPYQSLRARNRNWNHTGNWKIRACAAYSGRAHLWRPWQCLDVSPRFGSFLGCNGHWQMSYPRLLPPCRQKRCQNVSPDRRKGRVGARLDSAKPCSCRCPVREIGQTGLASKVQGTRSSLQDKN